MQENKLKAAVLYRGYLPAKNFGGPVVSLRNIIESCGDEIDFYVITLDHDKGTKERYTHIVPGPNRVGKAIVYYLKDDQARYNGFKEIFESIRPDVIYQNSFFSHSFSSSALRLSKKLSIPLILAPRGELCDAAYRLKHFKKWLYKNYISVRYNLRRVTFHVTSEKEYHQTMKNLRLPSENLRYIPAIPTLPETEHEKPEKLPGEIKLVFLSRIVKNKNLDFALRLIGRMTAKVEFSIYGQIEDLAYWEHCRTLINSLPDHIKAAHCGVAQPDQVHRIFAAHHLLLFPTQTENYGHVIAESMLSGCPVIISENTPWTDVRDTRAGWAIPLTREDLYLAALEEAAGYDQQAYDGLLGRCREYIAHKVEMDKLKTQYIEMFRDVGREEKC